jgi:hypothetical protein
MVSDFFENHKVFTTSQAKKAGYDKKWLKGNKDVVQLGTFPVRTAKNGRVILEKIYTHNPNLARLVERGQKLAKRNIEPTEEAKQLVATIEKTVSQLLGWSEKGETDERNDGDNGNAGGNETEGNDQEENNETQEA